MGARAGLDCVLKRNTGTYASPTWVEVKNVRNPGIPKTKTMGEVTTRRHGGYKAFIGTLKEFGLEFEMNADDGDTQYVAFEDSYWNSTQLDLMVLRAADATSGDRKGVRIQMEVSEFGETQDQEGHTNTTVKLVVRDPDDSTTPVVERVTEEGA